MADRQASIYRKVVRKTWRKKRFRSEPPELQLLLLYLWTGPEADTPGIYYISIPTIADDRGMVNDTVSEQLDILSRNGWLMYDKEARILFLPKWYEYDPPANGNVVRRYRNYCKELPESELIAKYLKTLEPYVKRYNVPLEIPYTNASRIQLQLQEQLQEQEHIQDQASSVSEIVSLSDSELEPSNERHQIEILNRTLEYYNQRVTDIGQTTFRLDMPSYSLIEQFKGCLSQKPFTVDDCRKAIDGCLSRKFNREKSLLQFSTIFKDADRVNSYIAASEQPEVDDAGNVIGGKKTDAELIDEVLGEQE